jgi:hypothetical protein
MAHAVDDILTNRIDFDKIEREFRSRDETRLQKIQKLLYKKRVAIPLFALLLVLIVGLSYSTYFFVTLKLAQDAKFQPEQQNLYKRLNRSDWQDNESLMLAGKFKIVAPVSKVILLRTQTDTNTCDSEKDCTGFMLDRQQNAYPDADDIRENFIIARDGTVFEGRGFEWEGETTCADDTLTCYNNDAISIAFVQNFSQNVSEQQRSAFCEFIRNNTRQHQRNISETFNVFHHDNLISSAALDSDDYGAQCSRSSYDGALLMAFN